MNNYVINLRLLINCQLQYVLSVITTYPSGLMDKILNSGGFEESFTFSTQHHDTKWVAGIIPLTGIGITVKD